MKKILLVTLLSFAQYSFGQAGKPLVVPGTKCSLIPPKGFVLASNFTGFQNEESGSSIMLFELPTPYQTFAEGLTAEAWKSKGMTLVSKQVVKVNGTKGTLYYLTQTAQNILFRKQALIFGDTSHVVMVTAAFPAGQSKNLELPMKSALLSTIYKQTQDDNPLAALPFSINLGNTNFKVVQKMPTGVLFGLDAAHGDKMPIFCVFSLFEDAKVDSHDYRTELQTMVRGIAKKQKIEISDLSYADSATIDGIKARESVIKGTVQGKVQIVMYFVLLVGEKSPVYFMFGMTEAKESGYMETFRTIANTFRSK